MEIAVSYQQRMGHMTKPSSFAAVGFFGGELKLNLILKERNEKLLH
jgi:hypothetical protein